MIKVIFKITLYCNGLNRDEESDDLMLPFLQKMRITWTNHDSYIEEAGKVENQDAATDIKLLD
jgi:hypothetical protein